MQKQKYIQYIETVVSGDEGLTLMEKGSMGRINRQNNLSKICSEYMHHNFQNSMSRDSSTSIC